MAKPRSSLEDVRENLSFPAARNYPIPRLTAPPSIGEVSAGELELRVSGHHPPDLSASLLRFRGAS